MIPELNSIKNICVIGLGYVGLPLAVEFSKHFNVIGFDLKESRIKQLQNNIDLNNMISVEELKNSSLIITDQKNELPSIDVFIITVPTPVDELNLPNMNPLIEASKFVAKHIRHGSVVVYESTVFPGATEEICVPLLEQSGLVFNKDFFCGYSPERINPGDTSKTLRDITKIVSGSNPDIANLLYELYSKIIIAGIHLAPSIKVAEAAKVIENSQRDINIAFMNELSMIFKLLDINMHQVLEAAETKWNFLPFQPGLVGGHCIGVDPYYLTFKAKSIGYDPQIILAGRNINDSMPLYLKKNLFVELASKGMDLKSINVLFLGVTFKENCNDARNSKYLELMNEVHKDLEQLYYSDPYLSDEIVTGAKSIRYDQLFNTGHKFDVIIIGSPHDYFNNDIKKINAILKDKNSFIFNARDKLLNTN